MDQRGIRVLSRSSFDDLVMTSSHPCARHTHICLSCLEADMDPRLRARDAIHAFAATSRLWNQCFCTEHLRESGLWCCFPERHVTVVYASVNPKKYYARAGHRLACWRCVDASTWHGSRCDGPKGKSCRKPQQFWRLGNDMFCLIHFLLPAN